MKSVIDRRWELLSKNLKQYYVGIMSTKQGITYKARAEEIKINLATKSNVCVKT